jgi:hypothetical protein
MACGSSVNRMPWWAIDRVSGASGWQSHETPYPPNFVPILYHWGRFYAFCAIYGLNKINNFHTLKGWRHSL